MSRVAWVVRRLWCAVAGHQFGVESWCFDTGTHTTYGPCLSCGLAPPAVPPPPSRGGQVMTHDFSTIDQRCRACDCPRDRAVTPGPADCPGLPLAELMPRGIESWLAAEPLLVPAAPPRRSSGSGPEAQR